MKNEQKIQLSFMKERLQSRMSYRHPDFAFDVLLYGWCKKMHHTTNWLSDMKRRGWMSMDMARDFAAYCWYIKHFGKWFADVEIWSVRKKALPLHRLSDR